MVYKLLLCNMIQFYTPGPPFRENLTMSSNALNARAHCRVQNNSHGPSLHCQLKSESGWVLCFALPETNPHQETEVLRLKGTLGPLVTIAGSKWHCRAPESESRLFSHLSTNTLIQIIANLTPKHFQMDDLGVLLAGRDRVYQSRWAIMSRSSLGPVILTWHWAGNATFPPKRNLTPLQKQEVTAPVFHFPYWFIPFYSFS